MSAKKIEKLKRRSNKAKNKNGNEKLFSGSNLKDQKNRKVKNLSFGKKSKEIEKELKKIYQDDKGKLPPMTSLEFKNKNTGIKIIVSIIAALVIIFIASFLGFLTFQPTPKFTGNKINLEIKAPFTSNSGENITYTISYANLEEITLTQSELTIYLPSGFIFQDASHNSLLKKDEQTADKTNIKIWEIGSISPGETGSIEINGKIIGVINSQKTISAVLSYIPDNFSSEFQKNISFSTTIDDSFLNMRSNFTSQIPAGEKTELNVKISNTSPDLDLENIRLEINYPSQFTLLSSQLSSENQPEELVTEKLKEGEDKPIQKIIDINKLKTQENIQIKFVGKFEMEESASMDINLQLKLKSQNDEYFTQAEEKIIIEVIKGELLANLIIQGSNQNKPVNFGDSLNYLLTIENKSKNTLGDIKVRLVMDSPFLDWATLEDKHKNLKQDNQILWTKETIPELEMFLPEDKVEINLQIKIKEFENNSKYKDEDYQIKNFFEAKINSINNSPADIVIESNKIINELNTDLELQANARYYDDDKLAIGSGPLPPIIGQKTNLKIFLKITNSLHDIQNIEVVTKLPDYVNYEGCENISTGDLRLTQNNELVWQISRIPNSIKQATAQVEISIRPRSGDENKLLTLIPEIKLQATDVVTKDRIIKTIAAITTNLDGDPVAEGKGLIQR